MLHLRCSDVMSDWTLIVCSGTTYLTLKVDGGRAHEIALIVGLLHGRRGPWAHHLENADPHPFHGAVVVGRGGKR